MEKSDELKKLQENMAKLEDLVARLGFMLNEVRTLIRK